MCAADIMDEVGLPQHLKQAVLADPEATRLILTGG
jgi:hypothetical protein